MLQPDICLSLVAEGRNYFHSFVPVQLFEAAQLSRSFDCATAPKCFSNWALASERHHELPMSSFSDAADPKMLLKENFLTANPMSIPEKSLGMAEVLTGLLGKCVSRMNLGSPVGIKWGNENENTKPRDQELCGIKTEAQCDASP